MNFRMVAYEGLLARDFMTLLENDPRVISYQEEPPFFIWNDGWEEHRYTPDVAVMLDDGRCICVEVKPLAKVIRHGLHEVYVHVARAATANGYDAFELWTDREIRCGVPLANANLVAGARTFISDESHLHTMRMTLDRLGGMASIRQLRAQCGLGPYSFRTILKLITRGEIRPVRNDQVIDDRMIVKVPSE